MFACRLEVIDQRQRQLADEISRELTAHYKAAAPAARAEMLMRMLNSPAPELRSLGVVTLLNDKLQAAPVPNSASANQRRISAAR